MELCEGNDKSSELKSELGAAQVLMNEVTGHPDIRRNFSDNPAEEGQ
jgi:hypothetical protein